MKCFCSVLAEYEVHVHSIQVIFFFHNESPQKKKKKNGKNIQLIPVIDVY